MSLIFYGTIMLIFTMMFFIIFLHHSRKILPLYTRTVVMVVTMIGSFYTGMVWEVLFSSLLFSMIIGVLTGAILIILMLPLDLEHLLHGFMQALMGGMMGGMLSGMVITNEWELMLKIFSLLVFSIMSLTIYICARDHPLVNWFRNPIYMAITMMIVGLFVYQIEISPSQHHSPHLHEALGYLLETDLS
ncbi:hypothetical protein [Pontibacillus sp. HMF3514]|uniref:hypothetical protein n=1 Tax=Pontibacillus sp. HMF3514 TaxID=2692425 RepID=UPI0013201885|nr:hypothetical protein [Pontibacillus sp. HMF3514]QHE51953.1 hypothetical protein GS400_07885 [Pontibacillus sp. HMF3514]